MSQELPSFLEDHISQIPALQLLQNLGWKYLTPAETVASRSGKLSNVLLKEVLVEQLRKLNRIQFKGQEYRFSEANIQSAVQSLKDVVFDGLRAHERENLRSARPGKELATDYQRRHEKLPHQVYRLESCDLAHQ